MFLKDQWYVILESKEVKNKPLGIKRLGIDLVIFRKKNNELVLLIDKCCHRGVSLASGYLVDDDIVCPFHGLHFDKKGMVTCIPANGKETRVPKVFKNDSYATYELDGFIFMYSTPNVSIDELEKPRYFDELLEGYSYNSKVRLWNTNYTRCIENQLDCVHVPFVHKSTIGRGNKTLVNGPVVKWDEELLTFYVFNEVDHGQKPLKPEEIENYEQHFSLQFIMPSLWQNRISDKLRVMIAFVPVDEDNTLIYLRYVQKMVTVPVLRDMFNVIGSLLNLKILKEDHDIVITQVPKVTQLKMEEHLFQGDLPILEYRRRLEDLKNK